MRFNLRMTLCAVAAAIAIGIAVWVFIGVRAIRAYNHHFEQTTGLARLEGKSLDEVIGILGPPDMPPTSKDQTRDFCIAYKSAHAEYACIIFRDGRVFRVSYSWQ